MASTFAIDHGVGQSDLGCDPDRVELAVDPELFNLVLAILADRDVGLAERDFRVIRQVGDPATLGQVWGAVGDRL